jgi:hypothetical protein
MDTPATYFSWGFVLISLPNLLLIGLMVALFVAALVVPFPFEKASPAEPREPEDVKRG